MLKGVQPLVHSLRLSASLAGPRPSGSTGLPRRCRGCSPPSPAPPGSGRPQLHRPAATDRRRAFPSRPVHGASWRTRRSWKRSRGLSGWLSPARLRAVGGRGCGDARRRPARRFVSCGVVRPAHPKPRGEAATDGLVRGTRVPNERSAASCASGSDAVAWIVSGGGGQDRSARDDGSVVRPSCG